VCCLLRPQTWSCAVRKQRMGKQIEISSRSPMFLSLLHVLWMWGTTNEIDRFSNLSSCHVIIIIIHKVMYSYVCCGAQSFSSSKDRRYSPHLYTPLEQTSEALFQMMATKTSVHNTNHRKVMKRTRALFNSDSDICTCHAIMLFTWTLTFRVQR
jgi:hypothetical protein